MFCVGRNKLFFLLLSGCVCIWVFFLVCCVVHMCVRWCDKNESKESEFSLYWRLHFYSLIQKNTSFFDLTLNQLITCSLATVLTHLKELCSQEVETVEFLDTEWIRFYHDRRSKHKYLTENNSWLHRQKIKCSIQHYHSKFEQIDWSVTSPSLTDI